MQDEQFPHLARGLPALSQLSTLRVEGGSSRDLLTADALQRLTACPSLTFLSINSVRWDTTALVVFTGLQHLKKCRLERVAAEDDVSWKRILLSLPSLHACFQTGVRHTDVVLAALCACVESARPIELVLKCDPKWSLPAELPSEASLQAAVQHFPSFLLTITLTDESGEDDADYYVLDWAIRRLELRFPDAIFFDEYGGD
jgi:hypothetical protein